MNKLAVLAGKSEEEFKKLVIELEEMSGFPSEDVRHLAEATQKIRTKLLQLGLDPDDTTGEELYYALQARYASDAASIDRALRVTGTNRALKAQQLVSHSLELDNVWAIKTSVAKRIIKNNVPKKLMKALHYRSVDSMLKHEDAGTIFMGADFLEAAAWHKRLDHQLAKLNTFNYELRKPKIVALPSDVCGKENVLINTVTGSVALNLRLSVDAPVLTLALELIDAFERLSENRINHQLHDCHPVLNWWRDTEHLLYLDAGRPISFNFKDIGLNHLLQNNYQNRLHANGQQSFWAGLMKRYQKYVDELPRAAAEAGENLERTFNPAKDLAAELVEV